jgi:post-segregation antitoxin (ccd killing protein)
MAHTYPELKAKPLVELREIAAGIEHEAVKGYTQLNKDHLLAAICKALGIDMHVHHEVKGIDKAVTKAKIHEWQKKRDEALAAKDRKALKLALNHIHHFKHALRKAMV